MRSILSIAAILISGAILGIGGCLAYQHFSGRGNEPSNPIVAVKENEHRLNMELAKTDREREFIVLVNNYFDAIDKAVEDKLQGVETDFTTIDYLDSIITLSLSDKLLVLQIRIELIRDNLLPLLDYYAPIIEKYGIANNFKERLEKYRSNI